jgi:ssDNA-binding replication factor A large subunit
MSQWKVKEVADDISIETVRYNFADLRAVQTTPMPCVVDLCVVVKGVKDIVRLTAKSGGNLVKWEIVVCDDTEFSMEVTVWGEKAENLSEAELSKNPVILIKGVNVMEWNERSGSVRGSGALD